MPASLAGDIDEQLRREQALAVVGEEGVHRPVRDQVTTPDRRVQLGIGWVAGRAHAGEFARRQPPARTTGSAPPTGSTEPRPFSSLLGDSLPAPVGDLIFGVVIVFLPVAAGIAILRYRLYDIDRLINRTLVYGLLTALLGITYGGVVLALGHLFGGISAQPPSWAVAGATLAVAALFQPARRRIQQVVDRRFNRRKFDAARTVEAFSARLRDEVDLDALTAELLAVVDQTIQPTRSSLWLRPSDQARRASLGH
jgi:hypothetical protein